MSAREDHVLINTADVLRIASGNKYRPLHRADSLWVRQIYAGNLPLVLCEPRLPVVYFFTPRGSLLASNYERVVIGDYGAFIECRPEHMVRDNIKLKWSGEPSRKVKYLWWIPVDLSPIRIYEQLDTVAYADYKVGMWYLDPREVVIAWP